MPEMELIESLSRFIGRTVTIFTTSGGISGGGFTGVLASVNNCFVKLITDIGAPPSCPVGSACCGFENFGNGWGNGFGNGRGRGCGCGCGCGGRNWGNGFGCGNNWLGSVTEIPICRIASFVHNSI